MSEEVKLVEREQDQWWYRDESHRFILYVLDENRNPIGIDGDYESDALRAFDETPELRRVGWTEIADRVVVSTVFLMTDHNLIGPGPPILFETMVFALKRNGSITSRDLFCQRYQTWEQAESGHHEVIETLEHRVNWRKGWLPRLKDVLSAPWKD